MFVAFMGVMDSHMKCLPLVHGQTWTVTKRSPPIAGVHGCAGQPQEGRRLAACASRNVPGLLARSSRSDVVLGWVMFVAL